MNKGTLVCGGVTFHIIDIRLVDSVLRLTATAPGPTPALTNEPVAIFGEDGKGFGQGGVLEYVRQSRKYDTVQMTFDLGVHAFVTPMAE